MSDMEIDVQELVNVWPTLDPAIRTAVELAIVQRRNAELEKRNADLQHQVEIMEQAVKDPRAGYSYQESKGNGAQLVDV